MSRGRHADSEEAVDGALETLNGPYLLSRGGGIRTHGLFVPNFAHGGCRALYCPFCRWLGIS